MNSRIKALWIADLRANPHLQGKNALHKGDQYCCLGRLCELHRLETGGGEWSPPDAYYGDKHYLGASGLLPNVVKDWAELPSLVVEGFPLWDHNDGKISLAGNTVCTAKTFPEIADLIEKHL